MALKKTIFFLFLSILFSFSINNASADETIPGAPGERVMLQDTFDDNGYSDSWQMMLYNPTGTAKQSGGRLAVAVDPGPTSMMFIAKKVYYAKTADVSFDVAFLSRNTKRSGPIIGFINEHFILSYLWWGNGEIRMVAGDAAVNPEKKLVYCCVAPTPGRKYRLKVSFSNGVATLSIDGKTINETKDDFKELPPVRLFFAAQNYDSGWRRLEFDNFKADVNLYSPRITDTGSYAMYSTNAREKISRHALSTRFLFSLALYIILALLTLLFSLLSFAARNKALKGVLLIPAGCVAAVLIVEIAFHVVYPGGYALRKFRQMAFRHDSDHFYQRNTGQILAEDGEKIWFYEDIRDRIRATGKRPAIVFIGDSITYGNGVDNKEQTFAYLAGRQLKQNGFAVETLNLSSPGYSTRDERYVLQTFARPLNLKILVVGLFYDDMMNFRNIYGHLWNRHIEKTEDGRISIVSLPVPRRLNNILFHTSSFYQWLAFRQMQREESSPSRNLPRKSEWQRNMIGIKEFCSEKNARLIVLLMPVHRRELDPETGNNRLLKGMLPYEWRYDEVEKFASQNGIETVRVASLLGNPDYTKISSDMQCHYNKPGQRQLAKALSLLLEKYLSESESGTKNKEK